MGFFNNPQSVSELSSVYRFFVKNAVVTVFFTKNQRAGSQAEYVFGLCDPNEYVAA